MGHARLGLLLLSIVLTYSIVENISIRYSTYPLELLKHSTHDEATHSGQSLLTIS